jgi:23S rRNA pseudouridine1911/1915/1917 synthase
MTPATLDILYEDNHLLALNKPAGLPTMGVTPQVPSLVRLAKQYLKQKYKKPGNVYLGVVSRLDAVASGVVLFARTSKAAARLTEQFRSRQVEKIYWAIVSGRIEPPAGEWTDWIVKDDARKRMIIARPNTPGAKQAQLSYRRLDMIGGDSLVEIGLETGRKHQIRLQLSVRGFAILGDRKYGSRVSFASDRRRAARDVADAIALQARRLTIVHPVRGEELEFTARLPKTWQAWGVSEN